MRVLFVWECLFADFFVSGWECGIVESEKLSVEKCDFTHVFLCVRMNKDRLVKGGWLKMHFMFRGVNVCVFLLLNSHVFVLQRNRRC